MKFVRKRQKTLQGTMVFGALVTGLLIFSITLIVASEVVSKSFYQQTAKEARTLSELSFKNMYQIMSQGWTREQLTAFREDLQQTYQQEELYYSIYRSDLVNQQFGELESALTPSIEPYIQQVLQNPVKQEVEEEGWIRILQPLKATEACLKCHVNVKQGDVLGIMAIEQNVSEFLQPTRNEFVFWMLLLFPIPVLLALYVGRHLSRSLTKSASGLNDRVKSIHQVDDLKTLVHGESVFEFEEFNDIAQSLNRLSDQIKNIAIDRDILDFEIQLLDRLVLSQEIIKDWKHHICVLMDEIDHILPLYNLFVVFRTDDSEQYVVEVFWLGTPDESTRLEVEGVARETMEDQEIFGEMPVFTINHTYASDRKIKPPEIIQTQCKSLVLDKPKIGGVVGLGLETLPPKDSSRSVVVESILTTLINVIGSIKAINKFTKELEYYATRDPLTHLFNQRVFHEMLLYEVERASEHHYQFSLLIMDFDNFKLVNDQFGHSFGDEVLKRFASSIGEQLRKGDIFCRYGGDEFCVVLPETDLAHGVQIGQSILEAASNLKVMAPDGKAVSASCSIGLSVYPDHAKNKEDLFMVADNMLYRVKDSGKQSLAYPNDEDLVEVYRESNDISLFIMDAIQTGDAIEAHYQPIVDMKTGQVAVHELLMRLRQENQLVSASRFIETAEHMGLVNQMDLILIDKAFAQCVDNNYQGLLFINLSPKAIVAGAFIKEVLALTEKYQLNHADIVFEITERETVQNIELLEKFVGELRAEGFRFAIDDFGSGFSSFQYLKRLPVDYIKIEGEFISNMTRNKVDYAFVESAVSIAQSLGIKTVAEFIENEETLHLAHELGIDFAQGYLLATPSGKLVSEISDDAKVTFNKILSE